jgi:hypothetical protein
MLIVRAIPTSDGNARMPSGHSRRTTELAESNVIALGRVTFQCYVTLYKAVSTLNCMPTAWNCIWTLLAATVDFHGTCCWDSLAADRGGLLSGLWRSALDPPSTSGEGTHKIDAERTQYRSTLVSTLKYSVLLKGTSFTNWCTYSILLQLYY